LVSSSSGLTWLAHHDTRPERCFLNDLPISQPIWRPVRPGGGTIGRADNNTLTLPDPERRISRQQAQIRAGASGYVITNVDSTDPIIVRNQSLALGESAPLLHNDQVRIGGYLLEVSSYRGDSDDGAAINAGPALSDPFAPPRADMPVAAMQSSRGLPSSPAAFASSSPFGDVGAPMAALRALSNEPPNPFSLAALRLVLKVTSTKRARTMLATLAQDPRARRRADSRHPDRRSPTPRTVAHRADAGSATDAPCRGGIRTHHGS
jgi:predicted component of type VI protein secretion system